MPSRYTGECLCALFPFFEFALLDYWGQKQRAYCLCQVLSSSPEEKLTMDHPQPIPALIVRVPSALCAFPLAEVIETMRPLPVESLANTPDFILGVSRIRGAAVPVIQLSALFQKVHRGDSVTRFVTLRVGLHCVALAVQSVVGIADLSDKALTSLPPLLRTLRTEFIQTLCTLDEELLAILNTARLVPESVWESLARAKAAS